MNKLLRQSTSYNNSIKKAYAYKQQQYAIQNNSARTESPDYIIEIKIFILLV
jgi:hypothetical protein